MNQGHNKQYMALCQRRNLFVTCMPLPKFLHLEVQLALRLELHKEVFQQYRVSGDIKDFDMSPAF